MPPRSTLAFQNPGQNKIATIRWIREECGVDLIVAKAIVEGSQTWDLGVITFDRAQALVKRFTDLGAVFTIKPYPKPKKVVPGRTWYERLLDTED